MASSKLGPWARRDKERVESYVKRVQRADVLDTITEALEAIDAGHDKNATTLLLTAVRRLAFPDDPREIRVRRVHGGRDL